ncbi:flippase [Acidisoma sp. 7E03]
MAESGTLKRLARNLVSTTVFQASGYILALINVPYLTRTLGVADYGILAFVISINAYLYLIVDWGFSLGATREVAQARDNPAQLREIFWKTMTAKAVLSLLATAILFGVLALHQVPSPLYLLLPGLLNVIGAVFTVDWFMQGLERMGVFTLYSIAGRSLVVLLTFLLVHSPADTWIACALQGGGGLFSGLAGFIIARRTLDLGRWHVPMRAACRQIVEHRHYFLTQSSWIAYSAAAPLVLALVAGSSAVGLFAAADRITRVALMIALPVSMVMYPRVNALMAQSRESAARLAGHFLCFQVLLGVTIGAIFYLGADLIAAILFGPGFHGSAAVLRWLAALPLLTGLGGALSRQFLIPLGWSRTVSRISMSYTVVYLFLLTGACYRFGAVGAAMALVVTETMLSGTFALCLLQRERSFTLAAIAAVADTPHTVAALCAMGRRRLRSS